MGRKGMETRNQKDGERGWERGGWGKEGKERWRERKRSLRERREKATGERL